MIYCRLLWGDQEREYVGLKAENYCRGFVSLSVGAAGLCRLYFTRGVYVHVYADG